MNSRVKAVRKSLHLSQEDFGKQLGVGRGVIVNIELNRAEIKPLFIEHLCDVFNVSEDWLQTGDGEMFVMTETSAIAQLCKEHHASDLERKILESYFKIDPSVRNQFISEFLGDMFASRSDTAAVNENESDEQTQNDFIEKEVEEYRRELELEIKGAEKSSALPDAKHA